MKTAALLAIALVIAGCASRAPAPVDERRGAAVAAPKPPVLEVAPTPSPAATGGEYAVKRGDTLYSIALEHGVDHHDLARWNRIDDPSKLRVGQTLRVAAPEARAMAPGGTAGVSVGAARGVGAVESRPLDRSATPPAPAVADSGMKTSPKAVRLPYSEQNLALLSKGESAAAVPKPSAAAPQAAIVVAKPELPKSAPASSPLGVEFTWPAKGKVIAEFSEQRNKGIDISGNLGDPVIAAAPGKVIYAGADIPGYGKFLVIKHANEVTTVYAHAKELLVKKDQLVTRGERIAEVGNSDSDRPKLHFQIRQFGKPFDPTKFLPPS